MTYRELSELRSRFAHLGLEILAFPSNDFRQEPGTDAEIAHFVASRFPSLVEGGEGSGFTLFQKSHVSRARDESVDLAPVYANLLAQLPRDGAVPHNFFKYLVDKRGVAVHRYSKKEDPLSFMADIVKLLDLE